MEFLIVFLLFNSSTNLVEVLNEPTVYESLDVCLTEVGSRVSIDPITRRITPGQMIGSGEIVGFMCRPEIIDNVNTE